MRIIGTGAAVAVGAGVSLAMSVAPAHADVWDRVAACESGGNWSINTGNGFHGGLQFTNSTWRAYGGSGSAQNASKSEQKRVARNVLKGQGAGAWPVCSRKAGLTSSNGGSSSSASYTPKKSTVKQSYTASKSYTRHYTTPKKSTATRYVAKRSTSYTAPSHTSYTAPSHTSYSAQHATGTRIVIHSGDTLAKLAARYHVAGGWHTLANKNHIANANLIFAGHTLYV